MQKWATQPGPPEASNAGICCLSSLAADAGRAANSRQGPTFFCVVSHWHGRVIWLADDAVLIEPVWASKLPANREIYREFFKNRCFGRDSVGDRAAKTMGWEENSLE